PEGKCMPIATRGGVRQVWREGHNYAVDMGKWTFPTDSSTPADAHASAQPAQVEVQVAGIDNPLRGVRVDVPNPHVVVQVSEEQLQALDLSIPPVLTPAPANGANVEFIAIHPTTPPASTDDAVTPLTGQITMRVWERGVGETRSCGTGVVAAAIVGSLGKGDEPARWQVSVPGGELSVWLNGRAVLIGPAVLVHQGGLVPYTETL
ncbi:MAG: hypothetical protein LBH48_06010, partial [Bifidobacteriaceae bacterium]|nr:hypothetical protein [Bifidobacteriaceae bacterium]